MNWHTEYPPIGKPILAKLSFDNLRYYVVVPYEHDYIIAGKEDFIPFYLEEAGGEQYTRWDYYELLGWVSFDELDKDSKNLSNNSPFEF